VKSHVTFGFLLLALISASSCGSSATPIIPTPPVPEISGDWLGEETVTDLSGGECLQSDLQKALVGLPSQFGGSITQAGSRVTATLDIDHTGAVCNYSGTIDGSSLTLDMTGCTPSHATALSCPAGGARGLSLLMEHITAVIAGDRISGTFAESDNILVSGSTTSVGTLDTGGPFTLMRR
jgi:hypothetical protein